MIDCILFKKLREHASGHIQPRNKMNHKVAYQIRVALVFCRNGYIEFFIRISSNWQQKDTLYHEAAPWIGQCHPPREVILQFSATTQYPQMIPAMLSSYGIWFYSTKSNKILWGYTSKWMRYYNARKYKCSKGQILS